MPPFTGRAPGFTGKPGAGAPGPAYRQGMSLPHQSRGPSSPGLIVFGVVVIVVGLTMLLDRTGLLPVDTAWRLWPFVLLAIGLARVTGPVRDGCPGGRASGVVFLLLGIWGLVSEFRLFGFDYRSSWPLLMIAIGLGIVWRSLDPGRERSKTHDQGARS